MKRSLYLLMFSLIVLSFSETVKAQDVKQTQYQRDSLALETYLDSIVLHLREPVVLKMADTMFDMAGHIKNRRRQAGALSYKVDYWFIQKNKDSLFAAIDMVQKFSRQYDQPIYYYFSWQRKITYYINVNQPNLALNELSLMQDDAIKTGDYNAQVEAYYLMGRIYYSRKLFEEAHDAFAKSIEMINKAPEGTEITVTHGTYLAQARTLSSLRRFDEEKILLDTLASMSKTKANKTSVDLVYVSYYQLMGNVEMAEHYLNLVEKAGYGNYSVNGKRAIIQEKAKIAHMKKDFKEEITLRDSLKAFRHNYESDNIGYANAYYVMGDYKRSADFLKSELSYRDSVRKQDIRNEISEMVVMLDVNRLKAERDRAELEMKGRILTVTIILSSFLFVLLVFAIIMCIKYYKTNRKLIISDKNLGEAVERLENESHIKSDFLRHLSHEVRTPLNSIVGFSNLISEKFRFDSDCAKYCEIIERNSDHLLKLVNDAVAMSNYGEEGKKVLTDINTLFASAIDYLDIKANKGVELDFVPCADLHRTFMLNKEKLVIILSNLLHNSSKCTKEGKIVMKADVDKTNGNIVFSVTDTGIGIPEDKVNEIFDYFEKVDKMTQGLGLGLPLSRHLAESMGGTLFLDQSYTGGCRMILTIPFAS